MKKTYRSGLNKTILTKKGREHLKTMYINVYKERSDKEDLYIRTFNETSLSQDAVMLYIYHHEHTSPDETSQREGIIGISNGRVLSSKG